MATHTYRGGSGTNEVHFGRRHSMNQALLLPQTSAQEKCTYGDDTPRLKDIADEKLSLD